MVGPFKKLLILFGKSVLALLSVAGMLLLLLESWLIWHFEFTIGLPTENQLATLPATGHLCSMSPGTTYVPLGDIPQLLRKAVIVSVDPSFYERPQVGLLTQFALGLFRGQPYWSRIAISIGRNCSQVLYPACCTGPSLDSQIGNILFAGRIEHVLSRNRILESYLNEMYLGRGAYGFAAGATAYFGKTLGNLEIDEIAYLVDRLRMPGVSSFSKDRRNQIIDKMHTAGLIDEAATEAAKASPLPWLDNQSRGDL